MPAQNPERAQALIDFWFGPPGDPERQRHRQIWFRGKKEHDDRLRQLFLGDYERAALEMRDSRWAKQVPERVKQDIALMTAPPPDDVPPSGTASSVA